MAEPKTKATKASVSKFIESVKDERKRGDAKELVTIFKEVTGFPPVMWGPSIIGYGKFHYKSERSSQQGDWPLTGFSPRAAALTLYIIAGFKGQEKLLEKLGPHKKSVGCLYIKRLSDIHIPTLKKLIKVCVTETKKRYPAS